MNHIFNVPSMSCQHCVKSIDAALNAVTGVKSVDINLDTKKVTVEADDSINEKTLIAAIEDEGFDVE